MPSLITPKGGPPVPAVWAGGAQESPPLLRAPLAVQLVATHRGRRPGDLNHRAIRRAHIARTAGARRWSPHGPCICNMTASVLLVIGYPLALGVLTRLRPVLAERHVWWFVVLEAATASITAGWLLHGRPLPAAVNGAALAGFAIAWLVTVERVGPPAKNSR
jgi:hypothetical protein